MHGLVGSQAAALISMMLPLGRGLYGKPALAFGYQQTQKGQGDTGGHEAGDLFFQHQHGRQHGHHRDDINVDAGFYGPQA